MTEAKTYPAGRYYVGDLCYAKVLGGDRWDAVVDLMFPTGNGKGVDGDFTLDGIDYWVHGTAYGDGCFTEAVAGRLDFGVDAGIIGILHAEDALRDVINGIGDMCHFVDFADPFTPYYEDGIFYIGHLIIPTEFTDIEQAAGDGESEDGEDEEEEEEEE